VETKKRGGLFFTCEASEMGGKGRPRKGRGVERRKKGLDKRKSGHAKIEEVHKMKVGHS